MRKLAVLILLAMLMLTSSAARAASVADIEEDPMFAVREGWAWPVVVVPPAGGWDTALGESVKYAMRISEREVSKKRGGIRGREIVFLYAAESSVGELASRVRQWRQLGARAIISFGGHEIDDELHRLCRVVGPAFLTAGGEELSVIDPATKLPYRYAYALDLHYFARANAIAEAIAIENQEHRSAVISDLMSTKIARGAALTVRLLRSRGLDTTNISIPAFQNDHFTTQVYELEAAGVRSFSVWLDAMATLSIWRTANINRRGTTIYYCGRQHPILLDADGLTMVDKDSPLERNELGREEIDQLMRDEFNRTPSDPVMAAKALALSKWVISAFEKVSVVNDETIADALAEIEDIPLMDIKLSIDPKTHRPISRRFGVLKVHDRTYSSFAEVDVFSAEVTETDD